MKKYLFTIILFALAPIFIIGQTLDVQKKDGTKDIHKFSDIASITFTVENNDLFVCGDSTVDYSGKTYHTVQIGTQCWFKENLDVGTMVNLTDVIGSQQSDNGVIEKYCYNNDASNCDTYGGLYEWKEAMQYVTIAGAQGICPSGWHLPSRAEIQVLMENPLESLVDISQTMDSLTATNETGFSGLFSGIRWYNPSEFQALGERTVFLTTTINTYDSNASYGYMLQAGAYVTRKISQNWSSGASIRCLKDF